MRTNNIDKTPTKMYQAHLFSDNADRYLLSVNSRLESFARASFTDVIKLINNRHLNLEPTDYRLPLNARNDATGC